MNKKDSNPKNQRIQVFARCRPLNSNERKQGSPSIVEVLPDKKEIVIKDRNSQREFFFDKVFPPDISQIAVYKSVVEPLIQEVLMGYNCTVFAYGQTGTGKTYTMEGERNNSECSWEDDPGAGIIPRSLHQLFEELTKGESLEFSVRVSFLELYNEELFDLLSTNELSRLKLFEDSTRKGSVILRGLEEMIVNTKEEVYAILERGTARRQTAATMLNATSSRSHTVFSVTVHIKENTMEGEELLKTGKLNLVDLAGSENVGRSGAVEKRAREAGNINQSLLTLGRVITALIEKQPHVPYRESKLTRLLQDSLGGHTKTSIIATISPAQCNFDETISTLDYATKAKSITIRPEVNQKMTKRALIREYTEEIERLRKDLVAIRTNSGFYVDSENYENMLKEITEKRNLIKDINEQIEKLSEENMMLEQFKSKYEETDLKLAMTSNSLLQTEKVLEKTALERDEKEYLLHIHCDTEKKLSQQAQTLLQIADQTTCNISKLHEKLERKEKVDQINEERCKNFKIMYQKQFANLDDMVTKANSQHIQEYNSIREDINEFVSGLIVFKQKFNAFKQKVALTQENGLSTVSTCLNEVSSVQKTWSESILKDLSNKEHELTLGQQKFMANTFALLIEKQNEIHAEMESWMLSKHSDLCQKIKQLQNDILSQSERQNCLVKEARKTMDTFYKHYEATVADLNETTQSLSSLQSKMNENIAVETNHLFGDIYDYISKKQKEFLKHLPIEQAEIKEKISKVANSSQNLESYVNESKVAEELLNSLESSENFSANLASLNDIASTMKGSELTSRLDSAASAKNSVSTEISKFIHNSEKELKSSISEVKNKIKSFASDYQTDLGAITTRLADIKVELLENVNLETNFLEEHNNKLLQITSCTSTKINDSEHQQTTIAEQLKKEILQRDLEFEKFIYEDLQKDIPTGTTPQKQIYDYPKSLAFTSPDYRILQRLRAHQEIDIKKAVDMPLDSSFDSDELKSPFIDITESTITNASSEDDLTGCETESNASSMSDLSVDGLRNKENFKFSKPSHLPKLKKKALAKPEKAPASTRKPLISKTQHISSN